MTLNETDNGNSFCFGPRTSLGTWKLTWTVISNLYVVGIGQKVCMLTKFGNDGFQMIGYRSFFLGCMVFQASHLTSTHALVTISLQIRKLLPSMAKRQS